MGLTSVAREGEFLHLPTLSLEAFKTQVFGVFNKHFGGLLWGEAIVANCAEKKECEAVESYRIAKGVPTPQGFFKVPAYLTQDNLNWLNNYAQDQGITFSEAIRWAIDLGSAEIAKNGTAAAILETRQHAANLDGFLERISKEMDVINGIYDELEELIPALQDDFQTNLHALGAAFLYADRRQDDTIIVPGDHRRFAI